MKTYTELDLVNILEERVSGYQSGQKGIAAELGFTPQFINDVRAGRRDMTEKLARSLGFTQMEKRFFRTPKQ